MKNACLSCRTKKAKCDGEQPVCGAVRDDLVVGLDMARLIRRVGVQCDKKQLDCVYVKSRRGGARKKRECGCEAESNSLDRWSFLCLLLSLVQ